MEKNLKRYKEKTLYCLIEDREERCIMSGFISKKILERKEKRKKKENKKEKNGIYVV